MITSIKYQIWNFYTEKMSSTQSNLQKIIILYHKNMIIMKK